MASAGARLPARAWPSSFSIGAPAVAIGAVTLLAGALRLVALTKVPPNPLSDAAVRSMALAWHNVVHAARTGRTRFLYLAALALGLAFNVKLFEALLPLPALAALYVLAAPQPLRRRVAHLLGAGLVLVAVSLAWLLAVAATPASSRP